MIENVISRATQTVASLKSILAKWFIELSIDLMARYKSKADARPKDRHIWSVDYG